MCDKLSDQSHIDNRVVVDGNLITSRGPGTSMEFALGIVEKFFGRPKALELAKGLLVVGHDVPNFDNEDHRIVVNYPELDGNNQEEFRTEDHKGTLIITEGVSDPINIVVDVEVVVAVVLIEGNVTTNLEFQLFFSESDEEPKYVLPKTEKVPTEGVDGFISFSYDNRGKTRAVKASRDMEAMKLKPIIP
ncbi:hypothetical protein Gotri_012670 [Gossypium trilobum]|uniref:DJ-1/PfpI domain-containing protein n=1 Tax=Gossypium trilobum TaxID=34281 RepID=A0A7J9DR30_9ROSI|nr:hypothetical protein [Gossypium trilobum]